MKITYATKNIQQTVKNACPVRGLTISFDSADESQNRDTVMFLVTTHKMILTGSILSKTTIFRLFQIERVCRQQF